MPIIPDSRYGTGIVGRQLELPPPEPDEPSPPTLDVLAAASRQATLAGSAFERATNRDRDLGDAPEDWEPLDHVAGYEDFADGLAFAEDPGELAGMKSRIDGERQDRETLRRAGLGGPVAEIGLNLLDPTFLVAIAVPELAIAKVGRMGRVVQSGVEGAAVASVYEGGQQVLQETRTGTQSRR